MRVPVAPDNATAPGEDALDRGRVWVEDGRDEDIAADEVLLVDPEELGLVGELEEERANGRRATCGRIRKEGVLWVLASATGGFLSEAIHRGMLRTQYGSMLYLTAIAVFDASATLSHL